MEEFPLDDDFDDDEFDDDDFDIEGYCDSRGTVTVRERIGSPTFRLLADIPAGELAGEVERILEMLDEGGIYIDLSKCSRAEAYRFLTTELMEAEVVDPEMPGSRSCFIYECFHLR